MCFFYSFARQVRYYSIKERFLKTGFRLRFFRKLKTISEETWIKISWLFFITSDANQAIVCLIWFFTTIFQLCRDGYSWVEPVLSKD